MTQILPKLKEEQINFIRSGFITLQEIVTDWSEYNFRDPKQNDDLHKSLGVTEEIGELAEALLLIVAKNGSLAHSLLKRDQKIRGTREEHDRVAQDAVGDIVIFLANFCARAGYDFGDIIAGVITEALTRDFIQYPLNGKTA